METNIKQRSIHTCTTRKELESLILKVEESQTYKHSFYVYAERNTRDAHGNLKRTYRLISENMKAEEATRYKHYLQDLQQHSNDPEARKYYIMTSNIFRSYWIYKQATDNRNERAQQWEDIKRTSLNYIKAQERRQKD